jgi:hypothetical protein
MTEVLFATYFVVLLATLVFKTPIVKGPWLFLMRAFFPNWKFFHAVGHVPQLFARAASPSASGDNVWSDWVLIYPRRTRRWYHLLHNPDTNLGLAQQNLVDHFWADLYDLPEGDDPRGLVTYAMASRLAQQFLSELHPGMRQYQFELRMVLSDRTQVVDSQVMMTAPEVAC